MPRKPTKKVDYKRLVDNLDLYKVAALRDLLPPCKWCEDGKYHWYGGRRDKNCEWPWNPFSSDQMQALLKSVGVPASLKVEKADEETISRVLDWARGPKESGI